MSQIKSAQSGDMSQLSRIGNVWLSEQPTEDDLVWLRDNFVTVVIDTRLRSEDRGFDERAYVVSLGMNYRSEPLDTDMDYSINYFDRIRTTLVSRRGVPTFIHGETADRAAAVWMPFRVLDEKVSYSQALAEAKIAGLSEPSTIRIVNQYLLSRGVDIQTQEVEIKSEPGPDEINDQVTPPEKNEEKPSDFEKTNSESGESTGLRE